MNEEQELRDRLAAVDVPPTRIEMEALVHAGRRRAFRRRSVRATGGVALATTVLLAGPSILTWTGPKPAAREGVDPAVAAAKPTTSTSPASPCRMMELPVPSGVPSATTAAVVDPTGRYVVGTYFVGQNFRSILWTDGQPEALPVRGESVQATAVNASGIVVGLVADRQGEYVFRYEKGAYTMLETPPGRWLPYPEPAINAAGDVIINVKPRGSSEGTNPTVLLWKAGSTTPVKLLLPAGANAFEITDDGMIVGGMYRDGVGTGAYLWDQRGTGRKLTTPAGQSAAAYAVRGDWVTGGLWPAGTAALWNLRTGELTDLGPRKPAASESGTPGPAATGPGTPEPAATGATTPKPGGGRARTQGPGDAVNASGWVVLLAGSVLRPDRSIVELAVPEGQTSAALDVSDTGLVVGRAMTDERQIIGPRVWRC